MIDAALDSIPVGRWAIGVSGGADSVALLVLLRERRPELPLHVVHLNHQTRGADSDGDAAFVGDLAAGLGMDATIAALADVVPAMTDPPANRSARFRAARLALLRQVIAANGFNGALYAHHADDQAETILHRLLRGSGWRGLGGMRPDTTVGGVRIIRPLLSVRRNSLRDALRHRGQPFREDASNASLAYLRNRLRAVLRGRDGLTTGLLELGKACNEMAEWTRSATPRLPVAFHVTALHDLPDVIRTTAGGDWLRARGVPRAAIDAGVVARLIAMIDDAASPAVMTFPERVRVRRSRGRIGVDA